MPRVLAGAPALDRRAFPRPGSVARWFEPFHVRQAQVARGEITAQVVAGADVVVAPAWLTHRRALEAVGESRRARAWTTAAVRLAHDAVEMGLERREGDRGRVLVAGPLPDVSAGPEHATGRRLPASASEEREIRDQAGILADVSVDLVLIEPRASFETSSRATAIAVDTGRPAWTTIAVAGAPGDPPLAERLAMLATLGAAGVLLDAGEVPDASHPTELLVAAIGGSALPVGLVAEAPPLAPADEDLDEWLEAGAAMLGVASGANPETIRPMVEARDRLLTRTRERVDAESASLGAWIVDAAGRAPGGRALWLGPVEVDRPAGFDWTVLETPDAAVHAVPEAVFRLVIALVDVEIERLARLVERGGVVAFRADAATAPALPARVAAAGLTLQVVDPASDGRVRVICRREDP